MTVQELVPDLQDRIAAAILKDMPKLRECVAHPGKFDAAAIKVFAARAPAVRIAMTGIEPGTSGEHHILLVAFIVTADRVGVPRNKAALAIAITILRRVIGTAWGAEGLLGESEAVSARNLYDSGLGGDGLALWAVRWRHPILLGIPQDEIYADRLEALYYGFEPEVGTAHEDDYIRIGREDVTDG